MVPSVSYNTHTNYNDPVVTMLYMGEGNIPHQETEPIATTNTPSDDEKRACYCNRELILPNYHCAGSCGRFFHMCCVPNTVFDNE